MEKIIKTLPELKSIMDANKFHTFDYTGDGYFTSENIEIIEIEIDAVIGEFQGTDAFIILYPNEEILFNDIKLNFSNMDLEAGGDDQYYDYSPAQVEAIIYTLPLLTPEHQEYVIKSLKPQLETFISNEGNGENDEDSIDYYSSILKSLEKLESDHRETDLFSELYITHTLEHIAKL